ncbi:hypothetical protein NQ314_018952 [Rhamnusium bicolor]|uniref:ZAD domain-containing protein n=1 Tax=Rhamnusium bicolor TaxID=1586634 RepID=A0AAV8WQQ5_9CUCU|nr:hypothetical protein NQ314_018952 [Rhamnusium bicolor]
MASNKTKICRLCIKLISTSNFEAIEEIRMDMLDVLLINMNFNISKEPVACNGCVETVQNCFDFKSTCFYVDDCIMPFKQNYVKVDISQVFRKKMKISEEIKLEYHQICRLCMALIENDSFKSITKAKSDIWVTNMVHTCLPELQLKGASCGSE